MRILIGLIMIGVVSCAPLVAVAQGPGNGPGDSLSKSADVNDLVSRMMALDQNKDGNLTRAEVTDERLLRLFDRADVDKNGSVTKAELNALGEREHVEVRGGGPGGGPGGPGGFGMPRPGEILSPMIQRRLDLSTEQEEQLASLQKEVDAKLATILNDKQKAEIKQMRERGPGRFGPPGGGPPGGGPPGGGRRGGGPPGGGPPPPPPDQ